MKQPATWIVPEWIAKDQWANEHNVTYLACGTCGNESLSVHRAEKLLGLFLTCRACETRTWTPDLKEFYDVEDEAWLDRALALERDRDGDS